MSKNNSSAENLITNNAGKETLVETMRKACKKIAPLWPLENFVAVNPYLGLTDKKI
jgi:GTPase involved in cell partitioning and DNA repair